MIIHPDGSAPAGRHRQGAPIASEAAPQPHEAAHRLPQCRITSEEGGRDTSQIILFTRFFTNRTRSLRALVMKSVRS